MPISIPIHLSYSHYFCLVYYWFPYFLLCFHSKLFTHMKLLISAGVKEQEVCILYLRGRNNCVEMFSGCVLEILGLWSLSRIVPGLCRPCSRFFSCLLLRKILVCVCLFFLKINEDIVAEWSNALHLGCSLHWRRFKSCRSQLNVYFWTPASLIIAHSGGGVKAT